MAAPMLARRSSIVAPEGLRLLNRAFVTAILCAVTAANRASLLGKRE